MKFIKKTDTVPRARIKKIIKISLICLTSLLLAAVMIFGAVNFYVLATTAGDIHTPESFESSVHYDCILVLGAGVRDGKPSDMLRDRLDTAIALYFDGVAPKLLFSGDHHTKDYDEVGVMKDYALAAGVPKEDIFLDHLGISTFDSVRRAKDIFGAEHMLTVTQKYHLPRAIFIAEAIGTEADGVIADTRKYKGQVYYSARECAARVKDFFKAVFAKDIPADISVSLDGDGSVTF